MTTELNPVRITTIAAVAVGLMVAMVCFGFVAGRGCAPDPIPIPAMGIDAGPGELEIARVEASEQARVDEELRAVEAQYDEQISTFDAAQLAELERVRMKGREELARWLSEFNRSLQDAGPR
jgi:hypothetical protein